VVYPCFCSRKEIAEAVARREAEAGQPWRRDPDGAPLYPGTCRGLSAGDIEERIAAGEPHAWRLDMEALREFLPGPHGYCRFDRDGHEERVAANPWRWGDAVIVRKEIPTSYHLSVVVDDALQGVTHVVRGTDLEAATDLHVLLQRLLGLPTPLYHHHGLIRDAAGDKLSKSLRSETLRDLRERGVEPAAIRERLGFPAHPRVG
jgi:glutamyl-Q tRNA(Asp) synthetase